MQIILLGADIQGVKLPLRKAVIVNGHAIEDSNLSVIRRYIASGSLTAVNNVKSLVYDIADGGPAGDVTHATKTLRVYLTGTGRNITYELYETVSKDIINVGDTKIAGPVSLGSGINNSPVTFDVLGRWWETTPNKFLTFKITAVSGSLPTLAPASFVVEPETTG